MTDQQQTPQAPQAPQTSINAGIPNLISFNTTAPDQQQLQQPQQPQIPQQPQQPQQLQQPQPQMPQAYQSIIDQQNEQISALIAQNQALTGQITQMVQGGAQFAQPAIAESPQMKYPNAYGSVNNPAVMTNYPPVYEGNQTNMFNPAALADDKDYSLEGLAEQIGKAAER